MWNEHIHTMGMVQECWFIAEVNGTALNQACFDMCQGIKDCNCEDLHVETAQDDDGKEYAMLTSYSESGKN